MALAEDLVWQLETEYTTGSSYNSSDSAEKEACNSSKKKLELD